MFSSRHFTSSSQLNTILIDIPPSTLLDTPVIPATLSYILSDVITTLTRQIPGPPNVTLASLDNHPSHFQSLSHQLFQSEISFVNAFSQWYPSQSHLTHHSHPLIATTDPTSSSPDSLISHISTAFQTAANKTSPHRILILDSLSTLSRYWPGLETFLSLRDALTSIPHPGPQPPQTLTSVTLIATFHSKLSPSSVLTSLKRISHTHISLTQGPPFSPNCKPPVSPSDPREIATLQITRRKPSGRVQLDTIHARIDWSRSRLTDIIHADVSNVHVTNAKQKDQQRKERDAMMDKLGLSFRVGVTTREREVRAGVGLSYLHRDEELADSALVLHPEVLQIGNQEVGSVSDESTNSEEESDEEEMFSEDV